jgi:hypothetical protein
MMLKTQTYLPAVILHDRQVAQDRACAWRG